MATHYPATRCVRCLWRFQTFCHPTTEDSLDLSLPSLRLITCGIQKEPHLAFGTQHCRMQSTRVRERYRLRVVASDGVTWLSVGIENRPQDFLCSWFIVPERISPSARWVFLQGRGRGGPSRRDQTEVPADRRSRGLSRQGS